MQKVIVEKKRYVDSVSLMGIPDRVKSLEGISNVEAMMATTNGTLKDTEIRFSKGAACCVVMASNGYPGKYETGFAMNIPAEIQNNQRVIDAYLGVAEDA